MEGRAITRQDVDLCLALMCTPGTLSHAALAGWDWPATMAEVAILESLALVVTAAAGAQEIIPALLPFAPDGQKASPAVERPQVSAEERAYYERLLSENSALA